MMETPIAHATRSSWRKILCHFLNIILTLVERLLPWVKIRQCSCCRWSGFAFRSFAVSEYLRCDVICPECGSFERHRALAHFYPRFFSTFQKRPSRIIHFAPEPCLEKILRSLCDCYERSVQDGSAAVELQLDLTALKLPDESCDVFLMNHVLDCMPDDRKAIREMYRVLKIGGTVLAIISFKEGSKTHEFSVPASNSCYRVYGSKDLTERFVPFTVSVENIADGLNPEILRRDGIPPSIPLFVMRKIIGIKQGQK